MIRKTALIAEGLLLCSLFVGCSKQSMPGQTEANLLLSSIQASEDPASAKSALDLSVLLRDLSFCLFPSSAEAVDSLGESYLELVPRMKVWSEVRHPSKLLILSLEPGLFSHSWNASQFDSLAQKHPLEHELWEFLEKASAFVWDCAPSTQDTFMCIGIWANSPVRKEDVGNLGWSPSIEPVLLRFVAELKYKLRLSSELTENELDNLYGETPEEFMDSILRDAQSCTSFLEDVQEGKPPSPSDIESSLDGDLLKAQADFVAKAIEHFQERNTQ